jgi:hypothetical protein
MLTKILNLIVDGRLNEITSCFCAVHNNISHFIWLMLFSNKYVGAGLATLVSLGAGVGIGYRFQ